MRTLQELEEMKDDIFEVTENDTYSTEYQVIGVSVTGEMMLPCKSYGDVQQAVDFARYMIQKYPTILSHCIIELQTSSNIEECPDTVGPVIIGYIRNKR